MRTLKVDTKAIHIEAAVTQVSFDEKEQTYVITAGDAMAETITPKETSPYLKITVSREAIEQRKTSSYADVIETAESVMNALDRRAKGAAAPALKIDYSSPDSEDNGSVGLYTQGKRHEVSMALLPPEFEILGFRGKVSLPTIVTFDAAKGEVGVRGMNAVCPAPEADYVFVSPQAGLAGGAKMKLIL